ncbi:MAG: beta-ketoacyl-ACP synthase III [bacterium]
MANKAYITRLGKFLPNDPVTNDGMEKLLGRINGKASRSWRIVSRRNGIKRRHYAIDSGGRFTHTNSEMTAMAVEGLLDPSFRAGDIELLCCGTSIPDQILPSHAAMVHGCLGCPAIEIVSPSGVCCSGMQALKYGMMSIVAGNSSNAVCTGSEFVSPLLLARNYESEVANLARLERNPILAFEKDFLRWMLSDGAGAALLQSRPDNKGSLSLRLDWIDTYSFAGQIDTCMYAGLDKADDGKMTSWKVLTPEEWLSRSVFAIKQDVGLLNRHVVKLAAESLAKSMLKHGLKAGSVDYYLPHISSEFFREPLDEAMTRHGIGIPQEKWFTNLSQVGNVGSASIYLILEELFHSGRLDKGMKLLGMVPESARFSYAFMLLTVC